MQLLLSVLCDDEIIPYLEVDAIFFVVAVL